MMSADVGADVGADYLSSLGENWENIDQIRQWQAKNKQAHTKKG